MKSFSINNWFKRLSPLFIIPLLVFINSCIKDPKKYNGNNSNVPTVATTVDELTDAKKVHPSEILSWQSELPTPLTFPIYWDRDRAKESVINGRHIIAVPISISASMFL